jgi:hypothetical protein
MKITNAMISFSRLCRRFAGFRKMMEYRHSRDIEMICPRCGTLGPTDRPAPQPRRLGSRLFALRLLRLRLQLDRAGAKSGSYLLAGQAGAQRRCRLKAGSTCSNRSPKYRLAG